MDVKRMYAKAPIVHLKNNHPTFTQLPDLREYCRSLFQNSPLNSFYMLDFSIPEQASVITTAAEPNQYFFSHQLIPYGDQLKPGIRYMPASRSCTDRVEMGRRFNLDNSFEIVEKRGEGSIIFGFATAFEQSLEVVNYYFEHIALLKTFIAEFQDRAQGMIAEAKRNCILIPGHNRIIENSIFKDSKTTVHLNGLTLSFSSREMQIMAAIYRGMTAKETAHHMSLSHRTVEAYINNIKNKVGATRKVELARIATQLHASQAFIA